MKRGIVTKGSHHGAGGQVEGQSSSQLFSAEKAIRPEGQGRGVLAWDALHLHPVPWAQIQLNRPSPPPAMPGPSLTKAVQLSWVVNSLDHNLVPMGQHCAGHYRHTAPAVSSARILQWNVCPIQQKTSDLFIFLLRAIIREQNKLEGRGLRSGGNLFRLHTLRIIKGSKSLN